MAKFDYASKCAHPRKIFKIMTNFVNENIHIEREITFIDIDKLLGSENLPFEDCLYNEICYLFLQIKAGNSNAAWNIDDLEKTEGLITINFSRLMGYACDAVRENAVSRSATLKGFSKMLLVLLHEVGHFATAEEAIDLENKEYEEVVNDFSEILLKAKTEKQFEQILQSYHYNKQEEILATDWAIEWLSNAENRKKAKNFEREFFKAWRGK